MKKVAILTSLLLAISVYFLPAVMADTIGMNDYVKLIAYNSLDSAGIMTYQISHDGGKTVSFTYDTFCIQENVFISLNAWYLVANVSGNVGFLNSPPPQGAGPLNGAADYLFYRYETGAYDSEFNGSNGKAMEADLQKLLWGLQGSGPAFTSVNTLWASDLNAYNTTSTLREHSWGTQVINIVENGHDVQNQLYNQVPEPSALLLIGFGLVGVAMVRRKIKK